MFSGQTLITELEGDTVRVDALVFSPDGSTLASAGYHGLIKLWNISDWILLGTLQNRGTAYTLDFFPDGEVLASTGHAAVTLWSVESGEAIVPLTGHAAWVYGAALSTDGKILVTGGDDGTVRGPEYRILSTEPASTKNGPDYLFSPNRPLGATKH